MTEVMQHIATGTSWIQFCSALPQLNHLVVHQDNAPTHCTGRIQPCPALPPKRRLKQPTSPTRRDALRKQAISRQWTPPCIPHGRHNNMAHRQQSLMLSQSKDQQSSALLAEEDPLLQLSSQTSNACKPERKRSSETMPSSTWNTEFAPLGHNDKQLSLIKPERKASTSLGDIPSSDETQSSASSSSMTLNMAHAATTCQKVVALRAASSCPTGNKRERTVSMACLLNGMDLP